MEIVTYTSHHLVKSEDLNHHGTLFAGRSASWFVEAGFVAAASLSRPENIVCLQIHGMVYTKPVQRGEIVRLESKIVAAGRTRLIAHIKIFASDKEVVSGFITFVNVDGEGKPLPHNLTIEATDPEDIELQKIALSFTAH